MPDPSEEAAHKLGIDLERVDVRGSAELDGAFTSFEASGADALDILASPMLSSIHAGVPGGLGALALKHNLAAICQFRNLVERGCLASYGVTNTEMYEIAASLTDKLLRGARSADLPVEQPTRFGRDRRAPKHGGAIPRHKGATAWTRSPAAAWA
jgi:putative ABC transport system substrate-binding protein